LKMVWILAEQRPYWKNSEASQETMQFHQMLAQHIRTSIRLCRRLMQYCQRC